MNNEQFTEDKLTLTKIKSGDRTTWTNFIKTYYEPIKGFIYRMVLEINYSEELTQDVFANFWNKKDEIIINTSLKAYLYRSARNLTLNFIKRNKYEADYALRLGKTQSFYNNETEERIHFTELELTLKQEINNLPEECKEIFKLSRYEDLSYKEIAELLDIPPRRVHYQIGIALKSLKEKLKNKYGDSYFLLINSILINLLPFF